VSSLPPWLRPRRELLIEPNKYHGMKVERYACSLGRVEIGTTDPTLTQVLPCTFRPDRVTANAHIEIVIPWWIRLFMWVVVPWIVRRYDWDEEEHVFAFRLLRPFGRLYDDLVMRKQREALSSCSMVSLSVDNVNGIVGEIPLSEFYYGAAPRLALPTVDPGQKIVAKFRGVARCTFTVVVLGFAADKDL
jgi:hypothetical protein